MPKALIVEILADARQFGRELDQAAGKTRQMGKVAGVAGLAIAGGLAFGLEKSVEAASKFQSSMELIHTQAGVSQKAIDSLGHSVLGLAGPVGTAPEELSAGLYHLASQGLRGAKALQALRTAAEGAKIGQANLEDVTNALGATIASGIKGAKNYDQVMGQLNATVGAGDMRMQDLADAMGTGVLAMAKVAGVGLKDVNAALAVFGDNNIRGAKAGQLVSSTLRVMSSPSGAAARALALVGINANELAYKLREKGLGGALVWLQGQMKQAGLDATQQGMLLGDAFGGRQAQGIRILTSQFERFRVKQEEVREGGNRFGADWEAYSKTSAAATDRLKASLEAVAISLGSALLPVVAGVTAKFAVFTEFLAKHSTVTRIAVGVLGTLAATLIAVSVAQKLVAAATVIQTVVTKAWTAAQWLLNAALDANPIGLVVIALAALGAALVIAWEKSRTFREIVTGAWHEIQNVADAVVGFFSNQVEPTLKGVLNRLGNALSTLRDIAKAVWNGIKEVVSVAKDALLADIEPIIEAIKTLIGWLKDLYGWAKDAFGMLGDVFGKSHGKGPPGGPRGPGPPPRMASGGIVTGPTLALIGEAGPEAVIPLPAEGLGSSGPATINVTVHGFVGSETELAYQIRDALVRIGRREHGALAGFA